MEIIKSYIYQLYKYNVNSISSNNDNVV